MPGKKKLTDLTGDGKITRKDFLRGAGVPGFKDGKTVRVRNPGKVAEMAAKEAEERRKDEEFLKKMKSTKGSTQRSAASEDAYSYALGGKVNVMECGGAKNALRGKKFSGTY